MKIFGGSNSLELAQEVAMLVNGEKTLARSEVTRFISSEFKVRIEEEVTGEDCILIQSTSSPSNDTFMELFFFCDALNRSGAKTITVVTPYLGYVRQDKQHFKGECISIEVIATIFNALPIDRTITIDLHERSVAQLFKKKFSAVSAFTLLAKTVSEYLVKKGIRMNENEITIVAPDKGGIMDASFFGRTVFEKSLSSHVNTDEYQPAIVEKIRSKKPHEAKAISLTGDVEGKVAIIVDDMVTSGGTLLESARLLLEQGAKEVYSAFTHADFTPEISHKLQSSVIQHFFTTNSISLTHDHKFEKLSITSVADILYQALRT